MFAVCNAGQVCFVAKKIYYVFMHVSSGHVMHI
jgi:hypothetical protein